MSNFLNRIMILQFLIGIVSSTNVFAQDEAFTKLFRFGPDGAEHPGVILPNGQRLDVAAFGEDYNEKFFESNGILRLRKWVIENKSRCPEVPQDSRIGACVSRPSKIVAIGLNYIKHAQETGSKIPSEPILFMKATTALCGPNDNVIIPKNSLKTDWEVELAIVIGKKALHVKKDEALDYVAGYAVINDYSERAWQTEGTGQWTKGKSADTFAPLGPYLVTSDAIEDPQNLRLWLKINGKMLQDSNTSDMIFKIPDIISYVSSVMTLLPGDVIATGTPAGVGHGMKPPRYLKPGEVVELGIEGLGIQKQMAKAFEAR